MGYWSLLNARGERLQFLMAEDGILAWQLPAIPETPYNVMGKEHIMASNNRPRRFPCRNGPRGSHAIV